MEFLLSKAPSKRRVLQHMRLLFIKKIKLGLCVARSMWVHSSMALVRSSTLNGSIFPRCSSESDGARATRVTRVDVVVCSIAASWARGHLRSITLTGTFLVHLPISSLKPHFLLMTCCTLKH